MKFSKNISLSNELFDEVEERQRKFEIGENVTLQSEL